MKISRHKSLRTIGWVAAYALALHTILAGLAGLPSAAAAAGSGAATLALCVASLEKPADEPAHAAADHCPVCFAGATAAPAPEPPTGSRLDIDAVRSLLRPSTQGASDDARSRPCQARAPPLG